jgi:hypothetical protein
MRRRYRIFEDAKYTPTQESIDAADNFFRANRRATEQQLTKLAQRDAFDEIFTPQFLQANGLTKTGAGDTATIKLGAKVTDEVAKKAREGFLQEHSIRNREKLQGGRVAKDRLDAGMFISREQIPKTLRALLGEIDDPREAYLGTIADLAQFSAVDDFYGTVADLAKNNSGIGKLFVDASNLSQGQQQALKNRGYVKLGGTDGVSSMVAAANRAPGADEQLLNRMNKYGEFTKADAGWGSLDNFYVPSSVYKDLTNQVLAEDSFGSLVLRVACLTLSSGQRVFHSTARRCSLLSRRSETSLPRLVLLSRTAMFPS